MSMFARSHITFLAIALSAIAILNAPAVTAEPLAPGVHGQEGALGFRWGTSARELERQGAKHERNSRYARSDLGEYYDMPVTPEPAKALLGGTSIRGHYGVLVDATEGLWIAMFIVDEDFESAADAWLSYQTLKGRITQVYGAPKEATEQNGTGVWTDKSFFDCLSRSVSRNWITASDCQLEASWYTATGKLALLVWGEEGEGHMSIVEFARETP